jgi:hypothetical protein
VGLPKEGSKRKSLVTKRQLPRNGKHESANRQTKNMPSLQSQPSSLSAAITLQDQPQSATWSDVHTCEGGCINVPALDCCRVIMFEKKVMSSCREFVIEGNKRSIVCAV